MMKYITMALAGAISGMVVFLLAGWMCGFEKVAYSLFVICCILAAIYVVAHTINHACRFIRWVRS